MFRVSLGYILREPLKIHFGYERICFPPELRREKPGISTNMPDSSLLVSRRNSALSLQKQLLEVPLSWRYIFVPPGGAILLRRLHMVNPVLSSSGNTYKS